MQIIIIQEQEAPRLKSTGIDIYTWTACLSIRGSCTDPYRDPMQFSYDLYNNVLLSLHVVAIYPSCPKYIFLFSFSPSSTPFSFSPSLFSLTLFTSCLLIILKARKQGFWCPVCKPCLRIGSNFSRVNYEMHCWVGHAKRWLIEFVFWDLNLIKGLRRLLGLEWLGCCMLDIQQAGPSPPGI